MVVNVSGLSVGCKTPSCLLAGLLTYHLSVSASVFQCLRLSVSGKTPNYLLAYLLTYSLFVSASMFSVSPSLSVCLGVSECLWVSPQFLSVSLGLSVSLRLRGCLRVSVGVSPVSLGRSVCLSPSAWVSQSVCGCLRAVSYTHLTLPTRR